MITESLLSPLYIYSYFIRWQSIDLSLNDDNGNNDNDTTQQQK